MAYRRKVKAWQSEKRKKGYDLCVCGAVLKYCKCGLKKPSKKQKEKNND